MGPCCPLVNLLRKVTSQLAGPNKIWARSTSSDALLWQESGLGLSACYLVRFSSGFVWLNSGLFQQRLALLDLSRSKQWRSHSSRTCTDRFIESQAPGFGLGPYCGLQIFMAPLFLGHLAQSHGIIATAAHSWAKIRTPGRQPAG